jgi:hypothetical protein
LLVRDTGNIEFVEVQHQERRYKRSGYSLLKLIRLGLKIIFYSTTFPLKFMTYGGFVASLVSLFVGCLLILRNIFLGIPFDNTLIIVTILFSTGILLFNMGIIGKYVIRLYKGQNKKPPYLIQTVLR